MSEQDIEKFVFDPENPRKCKVYQLLFKVVSRGDAILGIDPYFYLSIFDSEIFDDRFYDQLWDAPEDIKSYAPIHRAKTFVANYSVPEFLDHVETRKEAIERKSLLSFFQSRIVFFEDVTPDGKLINRSYLGEANETIFNRSLLHSFIVDMVSPRSIRNKNQIDQSAVLFVNAPTLLRTVDVKKTYVLVTLLEEFDFQNISTYCKPLLLKEIAHLNILLNVLIEDLRRNTGKKKEIPTATIAEFSIKNYFSIQNITIRQIKDKKEIYFLGENGDGKTILLQAFALALKGSIDQGEIVNVIRDNPAMLLSLYAKDSNRTKYEFKQKYEKQNTYENVFAYGINRMRNDSGRHDETGYLSLFSDEKFLIDPRTWIKNLDHYRLRGDSSVIDIELAKKILIDLVDGNIDQIDIETDEENKSTRVVFRERGTEVSFDQLSHGYRNVMIWVSDLVSRLFANQPHVSSIKDFRGVVLVDEVGLMLHPTWQQKIVRKLRSWFPNIQFFFTTHSPSVILGASEDAVFYKLYKEEGVTKISEPIENDSNMMANALLTSPLFNMESAAMQGTSEKHPEAMTDADYYYQKIHDAISQKVRGRKYVPDEEVMSMVEEELAKLEKKNDQG